MNISVTIQQRGECGNPSNYFSHKTWDEYKVGFAQDCEHWLGLEEIYQLTSNQEYSLKITLIDWDTTEYFAIYGSFKIGPESDGYRLNIANFDSTKSTVENDLYWNKRKFSTIDVDNDIAPYSCSSAERGYSGWWFSNCGDSNLNGIREITASPKEGIYWEKTFGGNRFDSWMGSKMQLF